MTNAEYARGLEAHYAKVWSSLCATVHWDKGPTWRLPEGFAILVYQAAEDMRAYATRGMAQLADENRLEIHMYCQPRNFDIVQPVELLTVIADYHRTGHRLGPGHTVNFGRPLAQGSKCTHGLLSLPYLYGAELEWCRTLDVQCLWLIPVTAAELAYKKSHGLEALEQCFEKAELNYLDVRRASVV